MIAQTAVMVDTLEKIAGKFVNVSTAHTVIILMDHVLVSYWPVLMGF
jgi:hypothetical protein